MPHRLAVLALALLPIAVMADQPGGPPAPAYSAATLVNAASGVAGELAPNTLAILSGTDLCDITRSRTDFEDTGDLLPFTLPGTFVTVRVGSLLAAIESVSPTQVTFLVPADFLPGPVTVTLTRNRLNGPTLHVTLREAAPALFLFEEGRPLARHADTLEWVQASAPGRPGEVIILYATGLGATEPRLPYRQMPLDALPVARAQDWRILLNGNELPAESVLGVSLMPGWPGLYQVVVRLPSDCPPQPEIQLRLDDALSPAGLKLPLALSAEPAQPDTSALR